ncbi:hypothetical protein Pmani_027586 [Petrolisthes manimaculis]|nr:hypothetical protein Pmani_027586 [Petrolisthes manimaculis]
MDHIQRNSHYADDESEHIRNQLDSLRCQNEFTATPTPFLYNVEAGLFDGPVQTMIMSVASEIYSQHLTTFNDFRTQHLNMFGPGFTLRHYSNTFLNRLIYYEPLTIDTAGVVSRLRDAGPVLAEQVINVLFERVVIHKNSSNEASSQLSAMSNIGSFTSTEALVSMNRLNESCVGKVVIALMKAAVLRKSRITVSIDIFNTDLESFVVSLLIFVLFPMDVVDEQTQRHAATCVAVRLMKLSKTECDTHSINDILRAINLSILNARIHNASLLQVTGNMLHNNETQFKMPLNFDAFGNTRIPGVTNWVRDVDRRVRIQNQDINFSTWFLRRATSTVERIISLNNVFGVLGAAFPLCWKNMDADRPIVLTRVDILSFCAMYEGVGPVDVPTESLSLNACVRSLDVQLQKIAKLSQEYENIIQDEGMSGEAVNDALLDLEQSLLEQAGDEAKRGDTTLTELLETMKDKLGKSALKEFIRLSSNDGPVSRTAYENVVDSVVKIIDDMPSRFGITKDLVLSRDPLPFYGGDIDYFGIFQNDEHPFRLVPDVQSFDAGAICGMSVTDLMERLANTMHIRGAFTYDLICSSDEEQYLSNVQLSNVGFSPRGELNLVPLNCDGKFINFNHFAVHALMYGRHSALSKWIQAFLPRHNTYVTPRHEFMRVADLQAVRIRFAQSHQEFDSPVLEFRKLDI